MRRTTSILLAVSLAAAGGMYAFQSRPAASGTFTGTISGGSSGGSSTPSLADGQPLYLDHPADSVYLQYDGGSIGLVGAEVDAPGGFNLSTTDVQAATLAQPMSFNSLLITEANPTGAGIIMVGQSRFWWAPSAINGNAHCEWDNSFGINCASALRIGAGASFNADVLYSRQGDRSVSVEQAEGLRLAPQATIGTCDNTAASGHAREGDMKILSGASLSARTRLCVCTSDGGGTPAYAWLNVVTGTLGTASACNN